MQPQQDQVTLYHREGSSDKVYQCSLEPKGEQFVVNFAYGRRGSTLNTGTKTSSPWIIGAKIDSSLHAHFSLLGALST